MWKTNRLLTLALTLLLSLALAPAALAQLVPNGKLGPIATYPTYVDPNNFGTPLPGNGYPLWVEDLNGVRLDLPIPPNPGDPGPYGDGLTAPTMIFEPPIAGNTLSQATGFGAEAFFFLANSVINLPNGGRALLVLGIEAAYGSGEPDPNFVPGTSIPDQFLFSRVRVRFDATVAGTYTVTHPWGVETLEVTAADVGTRFSHTFDWGGLAPLCPTQPSCFADGVSGSPSFERILVSPKPWRFLVPAQKVVQVEGEAGYILGDGVTLTTVTGGLNDVNSFTIVGPANAFGTAVNTVTSSEFTVSGHIWSQPIPTTAPPPPPPVVDTITITRAQYNTKNQNLEVRATSDNPVAVLTAVGYGILVNGRLTAHASPAPSSVTVTSSFGGSSTAPVQIK